MLRTLTLLASIFLSIASFGVSQTPSPKSLQTTERDRGIALYTEGRTNDSINVLRKVVKENKQDYEAWHFLGLALIQAKQPKEASKCFETALKINPRFAAGHAGLAYSLLLRNKVSDAAREADSALRIDPNIPDAHYIIGVVKLKTGKKDDALAEADMALKIKPDFGLAYLLQSQVYVSFFGDVLVAKENEDTESRKERYRQAAGALEKYLQLVPNAEYKQTWLEQLESLRVFSASSDKNDPNHPFSGKEVTNKVRVLSKPEPTYTESARRNQVTGTIVLRCVFAADGTVKHFLVVDGLPDGLTEMAISAARKIKFVPATINGRPVSMMMELQYNFNLY